MADPLSIMAIGGLVYAAKMCSEKYESPPPVQQVTEEATAPSVVPPPVQQEQGGFFQASQDIRPSKMEHPSFGDVAFMKHVNGEPVLNLHDRPYVSGKMNNFSGVSKELVGPGLGVGPDVPAYGGYQQLFRVNPVNVNAYRLTTLPGRPGPAHSVIGGAPTVAGALNHKAPPKTAFLPTRRPEVRGRAQGQGGALTGVTVRGRHETTKRPTNRAETTTRGDGLEFAPAKRVVSALTLPEEPTRNKGDLNMLRTTGPSPGIVNFKGGYTDSAAVKLMDSGKGPSGAYSDRKLEKYGFRPDDKRGNRDRGGNPGRMNVRASPVNQGGLVTAVRTDQSRTDGRVGPVNGGWSQNYTNDSVHQLNPYKGTVNFHATNRGLDIAKNQLASNPLAHTLAA
jgi:hypothetical protein